MKNQERRGVQKRYTRQLLTTYLVVCALLFNTFVGALWGGFSFGAEVEALNQAKFAAKASVLEQAINKSAGYFTIVKKGNQEQATLSGFWQMSAIKTCGLSLDDYRISDVSYGSADYEKYFYYYLTDRTEEASALAQSIAEKQNTNTGALSSIYTYHIWNSIVLSTEAKIHPSTDYDGQKALDYLLLLANSNGSFGLNGAGDTDITGMALIALSFYSGQDEAELAITKAVNFLKTQQTSKGGFTGIYGENINSAAAAISGLQAVGQDLSGVAWIKNGKTVQDYVLNCMGQDGSFGNDLATEQGLIALVELSSAKCIWSDLGSKIVPFTVVPDGTPGQIAPDDTAVRVSIRVEGPNGILASLENQWVSNFDLSPYHLNNTTKVSGVHVLIKALESAGYDCKNSNFFDVTSSGFILKLAGIAPPSGDYYASWFSMVNDAPLPVGDNGYSMTITEYLPEDGDELVIPYLKHYGTAWYSFFEKGAYQGSIGEDITLNLKEFSINDVMWGMPQENTALVDAEIYVDGQLYDGWINKTDSEGNIKLRFMKEGKYRVSAKLDNGMKWIVRPEATVTVTGKSTDKAVSFRVEGSEQNILYIPNLTVKTDGRLLSVQDALTQAMQDNKIDYQLQGSYLKSLNGEQAGKFGGFDGWMYFLNGKEATTSMDRQILHDGDEVVFFYGVFGTSYPKITMNQNTDSIEMTFMSEAYDESGVLKDFPIIGATVTVFGKSYITDSMGKISINKDGYSTNKESKLQINKIALGTESDGWGGTHPQGSPLVVRLSPDYTIKLTEDGTLMQSINASDSAIEINPTKPLNITVLPGMSKPCIKLNGGTLPQLEVQNGQIKMSFASGTKITTQKNNENSIYTGVMELPTLVPIKNFPGNKVANVAIKAGTSSGDLYFSQPIRLLIPGGRGLSTGVLHSDGMLKEITENLQEDSLQAAKSKLKDGVDEARIPVGNDMAVWTNHLSTYVSYSEDNSPDPNNPPNAQVTLYVEGAGRFTIPYTSGMTPLSILLEKVGNVSHKGGYVSGINGRMEFAEGPGSGWMYAVNGTYYKVGADTKLLKAGDSVEWRYTKNFGDDLTGTSWSQGTVTEGAISVLGDTKKLADVKKAVVKHVGDKPTNQLSDFEIMVLALVGHVEDKSRRTQLQSSLMDQVKDADGSFRKVTDRARIVLAARAVKLQPSNIGGYNMVESLVNHENIEMQGVNGPAFALIAYDALGLKLPKNTVNSREKLKKIILNYQSKDGGFSLAKGGKSDPDITAMVVTALAPYKEEISVKSAVDKAVAYLSSVQKSDGGFVSEGASTSESISQVIIALCALGLDPLDKRFVKGDQGEYTLPTSLYAFQNTDGGFAHVKGEKTNTMATEQAALAVFAYEKLLASGGKQGVCIYDMLQIKYETFADKTDIAGWALVATEKCQKYGIMAGDTLGNFLPKKNLNRAEASKIMVSLLQLPKSSNAATPGSPSSGTTSVDFRDVSPGSWYYGAVNGAAKAGVVSGKGAGIFDPEGSITREDFAVMLVRALGGISASEFSNSVAAGKDMPKDMEKVAVYGKEAVVMVYSAKLMQGSDGYFNPKQPVSREMIAVIMERIYEQYFE